MDDGIIKIHAEVCIEAKSEVAARALAASQFIEANRCRWSPNRQGAGGHLYIGGPLYVDPKRNQFTFHKPKA